MGCLPFVFHLSTILSSAITFLSHSPALTCSLQTAELGAMTAFLLLDSIDQHIQNLRLAQLYVRILNLDG